MKRSGTSSTPSCSPCAGRPRSYSRRGTRSAAGSRRVGSAIGGGGGFRRMLLPNMSGGARGVDRGSFRRQPLLCLGWLHDLDGSAEAHDCGFARRLIFRMSRRPSGEDLVVSARPRVCCKVAFDGRTALGLDVRGTRLRDPAFAMCAGGEDRRWPHAPLRTASLSLSLGEPPQA